MQESSLQSFQTIYANSIWIADRSAGFELINQQKHLPKSNRKIYVLIGPKEKIQFYSYYYAEQSLFIPPVSDDSVFNMVLYSIAIRKGLDSLHRPLNGFICRLKHSGIHQYWKSMAMIDALINARSKWHKDDDDDDHYHGHGHDDDDDDQQFSLKQLQTIFYSYLILLAISIISFNIEFIYQFLSTIFYVKIKKILQ
ncbi:hypothetical protein BLA29_006761 [Euroglyphus maynei]|uniref:Uncharacterized protein n=1 Tax=Euroglyphus maynei TaxID=6958 RepID=A0A1Y3B343_EURMA|nr:hypothetical protein BLA29_006761 [Euroglyphus maynei]